MNNLDNYQYLSDASIRIDDVTFRPWPDFCIIGEVGCGKNHLLPNLLVSSDPLAMMWRGKIPTEVLELIRRFSSVSVEWPPRTLSTACGSISYNGDRIVQRSLVCLPCTQVKYKRTEILTEFEHCIKDAKTG